jgi:hypothetical protein
MSKLSLSKKIAQVVSLVLVAIFASTQGALALSPAQKALYNQGTLYFDIDTGEAACTTQSAITLTGNSNAAKAFNFLTGQGLNDYQAAAVVGNLQAESSMMPNRKQGAGIQTFSSIDDVTPGVGFGIAQWTSARRQAAWKNLAK